MPAQVLSSSLAFPRRLAALERRDLPPVLLIAGFAGIALLWNMAVGLRWSTPLPLLVMAPATCFALTAVYRTIRPEPAIAEATLYAGLWFLYPVFGAQLTYLANHLAWPLHDRLFNRWDTMLGFRWMDWVAFINAHPPVQKAQAFAYESCLWQPVISIMIFAKWGPKGRNSEFLTAMLLALAATIAVNLFLPALGPADFHGLKSRSGDIIAALRAGATTPYAYSGIIAFPSFHTVIAILYTAAHRGNRYTFPAFLVLNGVMLSAIPYSGNHYLVDMIAGAAIAIGALFLARRSLRAEIFQTQTV